MSQVDAAADDPLSRPSGILRITLTIMPESEPQEKSQDPTDKKPAVEEQSESGYYYDDAHGYENFDPEKDDEEVKECDEISDEVDR